MSVMVGNTHGVKGCKQRRSDQVLNRKQQCDTQSGDLVRSSKQCETVHDWQGRCVSIIRLCMHVESVHGGKMWSCLRVNIVYVCSMWRLHPLSIETMSVAIDVGGRTRGGEYSRRVACDG